MASSERVVGAADNVDMSGPADAQPYERDLDERRVVSAYCCTCEATTTMLLEVGDSEPWGHDAENASHVVEYWREA